jgi:glycosyltransferase involved in cell wall biosynthesis
MEKGVTLIIPLYNKVENIRQTLDSVVNNHGSYPFKCIIIDDDSTDGSSEIAEEYDRKHPDIFSYIKRTHHEVKTPSFARNIGIKLTDTEYIAFLDADDEICIGFIDRGCTFLDEHPQYSMYGCGYMNRFIDSNGKVYYNISNNTNKMENFIDYLVNGFIDLSFCANIYKTELVKEIMFRPILAEDMVFKLSYIYKNQNIYYDNTTSDSFIWNHIGDNHSLHIQPLIEYENNSLHGIEYIFSKIKEAMPEFNYGVKNVEGNDFILVVYN